jgi:hypothetical protein
MVTRKSRFSEDRQFNGRTVDWPHSARQTLIFEPLRAYIILTASIHRRDYAPSGFLSNMMPKE